MTFRVQSDRQDAIRKVVNAIKDDPGLTESMLEFLRVRSIADAQADPTVRNLGPFRSEDAALSFLVGRLRAALRPEAIFLFGSRALESGRPDSDFDLLVILSDRQPGPPDYFAAYAPLAGCGIGVDVVPCCAADFEVDRHQEGTIAHAADRQGRLLYARPGGPFRARWRGKTRSP
jgi:predicted nucleotidyltransferase